MTTKTTANLNPTRTTATPCPSWCTVDHSDMPPGAGFHASDFIGPEVAYRAGLARLWQTDQPGATAGVVVAGELLTEHQAHGLGLALIRAAKALS